MRTTKRRNTNSFIEECKSKEYDYDYSLVYYKPIDYYGGNEEFKRIIKRDKIKSIFCKKNRFNLLRIRFNSNIKNKLIECLL
jgi:hypothetical protein